MTKPEIAFAEAEMPKRKCRRCEKFKTIAMYSASQWKGPSPPMCRDCVRKDNRKSIPASGRVDEGFQYGRRNIHGVLTEPEGFRR